MSNMNIMAGLGVAVREFQLTTGEADYGLYIDGKVAVVTEEQMPHFSFAKVYQRLSWCRKTNEDLSRTRCVNDNVYLGGRSVPFMRESTILPIEMKDAG